MNELDGTPGDEALTTAFAPAERASAVAVERAVALIACNGTLSAVLDAAGVHAAVLNQQRQVVFANQAFLQEVGAATVEVVAGQRHGEALGCVNAWSRPGGCGTSEACAGCGAAQAVLDSQRSNQPREGECLLTLRRDGRDTSREYRFRATPIELQDEPFTVVCFRDISAHKRRRALERVFFHDLKNTVTGLKGYADMLGEGDGQDHHVTERLVFLTDRLHREIEDQRMLLDAENGVLRPRLAPVTPAWITQTVERIFASQAARLARHLTVTVEERVRSAELVTDQALLVRVLGNMIKNALEAAATGEEISIRARGDAARCVFEVRNPGQIPADVQAQIFRRSFSTKGEPGRGLGTYSMKLFGETHLGGEVTFDSGAAGTAFRISLPWGGSPAA